MDTSKNALEVEQNLLKIIPTNKGPWYVIRLSNTINGYAVLTIINDTHIGYTKSYFEHYRFEYFNGEYHTEEKSGIFKSIDEFLKNISFRNAKPFPFQKMNYDWSYSIKPWIEGCISCNHPTPTLMDPITKTPYCGTECHELYKNIIN
jgi:hypothetical protein